MKKITGIFLVLALAIFSSCEGPVGPVGPTGPPGEDGVHILGSVFEIQGDFTNENDYALYYAFPDNFEVFDSDIVLVYIRWEQANDGEIDVWRMLPQTVVLEEGVLQYNFDYTLADVQVYLEGTIPFSNLLPSETDNQIFRIAVLPADFAVKKSVNINDLNEVMNTLKINPSTIKKATLTK